MTVVPRLGIDRAVAYTFLSRGWQLAAGAGNVVLIAACLSPVQQGFFYTFSSLLYLQHLCELGLTGVLVQFASHEMARLDRNSQAVLEGSPVAKARLSSLMRFSLWWYAVAALLFVATATALGLVLFGSSSDAAQVGYWREPWVWLVLVIAGSMALSPVMAVMEGCGLVAEVARIRLVQDALAFPVMWASLLMGLGLFAAPLAQSIRLVLVGGWLLTSQRAWLLDLIRHRVAGVGVQWWREVWPVQWRIAVSWISGYFVLPLFNPVLFALHGARAAGQMGMTLSITGAVTVLGYAWVSARSPQFGRLIARGEREGLDSLFFGALRQAVGVAAVTTVALASALAVGQRMGLPMLDRILDPVSVLLLLGVALAHVVVWSEAAYLRAHKVEPFLGISVVTAVFSAASTLVLGSLFAAPGIALGYFVVTMTVGLGGGTRVFRSCRRMWRASEIAESAAV